MDELIVLDATDFYETQIGKIIQRLNALGYEIKSYDATHVVIIKDEVMCAFHLMDELTPDKKVKRIKWIASSETSENSNIKSGSKAISYIIDDCKNEGVKKILLSVRETNRRAIHLYKKFGFKFTDKKEGKEVEMEKILSSSI